MNTVKFFLWSLLVFFAGSVSAQDLLNVLDDPSSEPTYPVEASFKGTRLINGHSVETRKKNNLDFIISHRFGKISGGAYEFYGLDQSNIRLGFDYGVTDRFNIGIGRNSFEKTYDGYAKYRLIRQMAGSKVIPVSVTWFSSMALKTLKDSEYDVQFVDRLAFVHQLLIARKFSSGLSIQLMPSYVHYNAITAAQKHNDVLALGVGGRIKLTQRISFNAEYYYQFQQADPDSYNSLAVGFDIETGGHVFQLQFTNSQAMLEKGFIGETNSSFFKGDIHFGFNISRTFQLGDKTK